MIPQIKQILYTTDLSDNARHAFGYAASLSERYNAKISVLHVIEELSHQASIHLMSLLGEERWNQIQKRNAQEVRATIKTRLEAFCDEMNAELDQCSFMVTDTAVRLGEPVEQILMEAEKIDADLIVMGTHGHNALAGAMLGSTARRVVRRSVKPVLTIRLP